MGGSERNLPVATAVPPRKRVQKMLAISGELLYLWEISNK